MKKHIWTIGRYALGIILIIIGLAALVTPLTPGAWLGLIGLELVGLNFLIPHPVRRHMQKMYDKWKRKKQ